MSDFMQPLHLSHTNISVSQECNQVFEMLNITLSVVTVNLRNVCLYKCGLFVVAVCDPNCGQCDVNGPEKCDDGHCNTGFVFVNNAKTCARS